MCAHRQNILRHPSSQCFPSNSAVDISKAKRGFFHLFVGCDKHRLMAIHKTLALGYIHRKSAAFIFYPQQSELSLVILRSQDV